MFQYFPELFPFSAFDFVWFNKPLFNNYLCFKTHQQASEYIKYLKSSHSYFIHITGRHVDFLVQDLTQACCSLLDQIAFKHASYMLLAFQNIGAIIIMKQLCMLSLICLSFELLVGMCLIAWYSILGWYVLTCLDIYLVSRTWLLGSFKLYGLPQLEQKEFLIFWSPSNLCHGLTPYI